MVNSAMRVLPVAALLTLITGCGGLHGKWKLDKMDPPSLADSFRLEEINFARDGESYTAKAVHLGQPMEMSGTYTYDKETGIITFQREGKEPRKYRIVAHCGGCGLMTIQPAEPPFSWTAKYKRR